MANFAIKVGTNLLKPPQTSFANINLAMNYTRDYVITNHLTVAIIGTSLTSYNWKFELT